MDFDNQEKQLNWKANRFHIIKSKIKWLKEEIQLRDQIIERNDKTIEKHVKRITYLETRIFFAVIDRYLDYLDSDIFLEELHKEYKMEYGN